jgi:hypothetical protein
MFIVVWMLACRINSFWTVRGAPVSCAAELSSLLDGSVGAFIKICGGSGNRTGAPPVLAWAANKLVSSCVNSRHHPLPNLDELEPNRLLVSLGGNRLPNGRGSVRFVKSWCFSNGVYADFCKQVLANSERKPHTKSFNFVFRLGFSCGLPLHIGWDVSPATL